MELWRKRRTRAKKKKKKDLPLEGDFPLFPNDAGGRVYGLKGTEGELGGGKGG